MKAHVTIHSYESDKDAIYFTSKIGGALGFDIELPDKWRFCPKGINAIRPLLAKALGILYPLLRRLARRKDSRSPLTINPERTLS